MSRSAWIGPRHAHDSTVRVNVIDKGGGTSGALEHDGPEHGRGRSGAESPGESARSGSAPPVMEGSRKWFACSCPASEPSGWAQPARTGAELARRHVSSANDAPSAIRTVLPGVENLIGLPEVGTICQDRAEIRDCQIGLAENTAISVKAYTRSPGTARMIIVHTSAAIPRHKRLIKR